MFESLIVTLREGIEAALVIGILLTYLKQIEKEYLNKAVYLGVALALIASIIGAVIFQKISVSEELYEGSLFFIAALFVGSMMFWMIKVSKSIKKNIHSRVDSLTSSSGNQSIWSKAGWGILLFTFLMVFREGIETVLFLSAVSLTTEAILSFIGGVIGLLLAIAFCVFFVKGTLRIDLQKFFSITEIVLGIFVVQLIINGYHEFAEAGILPATQQSMALVGPLVKNNILFLLAILLIPLLFLVIPGSNSKKESLPEEGPERRKVLARQRSERSWKYATALLTLFIIIALGVHHVQSSTTKDIPSPDLVTANNGVIQFPLSEINDGNLHRYALIDGDATIRFLVMKTGTDKIATALDACEICGDYGYMQDGKNLVCLNCSADIYGPTIGVVGGCNPIPLKSTQSNGNLVIQASDLISEKGKFVHATQLEVIDPVCEMKLRVTKTTPSITYQGKTYYFCTMEKCMKAFQTEPEKYVKK